MILHLVRHPRPVVPAGVCYGRLDVPATDVEAAAARLKRLLLPGLPVWSSPLARCRVLAEQLHPRPAMDDRLAEIHFGEWEGRAWDDIDRAALDAWAADVAGYVPPGGESATALQARALACVAALPAAEAVLVTHAGVMRVLLAHWLDLAPARWTELRFDYAGITTIELNGQEATLLRLNR